ncbi:MAG: TlpA family protein disulfide reductase [Pyrinomonadaceae bacterium]|nr:TlpA family protein disulfide reductase [Pyrinomonadaceae bacterium]
MVLVLNALIAFAQDGELTGQFETSLVANTDDVERVVFKLTKGIKGVSNISEDAHLTTGRLFSPQTGKFSVLALLVEEQDEKPVIFVDLDGDNAFKDGEKFVLKREEPKNPYLWIATINLPIQDKLFTTAQVFIRYFRDYKTEKMTDDDRLFQQSTEVLARGKVDLNGKPLLVQYAYSLADKRIDPQIGTLGVDTDGDGEIFMDSLSPEYARAKQETVIFRVGQNYISTKKVDLGKNQIVLKQHKASDYKRIELSVGADFPDFQFTDLKGKKRKFSEFKGKYVLLDVWGFWCPPCREELPYLREAYRRFQPRNFEIVGLNTDEDFSVESIRDALNKNGMTWTQAEFTSIVDFIKKLRISTFPSTILISPEGKILSMSRSEKKELDLRGKDLLETLDEVLPQ